MEISYLVVCLISRLGATPLITILVALRFLVAFMCLVSVTKKKELYLKGKHRGNDVGNAFLSPAFSALIS